MVHVIPEVDVMPQVVMDRTKQNEGLALGVMRQCPTCERCRDCGYTHIGIVCPDPNVEFDGTCLCDPSTSVA
jgi:hypothetical protein